MRHALQVIGLTVAASSALITVSCGAAGGTLIFLETARPELAAYVEVFNASQGEYRVVTRYVENVAAVLLRDGTDADVLIGSWLTSRELARMLRPLDRLLRADRLLADSFFPTLLEAGRVDQRQIALPLSFGIPAVVFRGSDVAEQPFAIDADALMSRALSAHTEDLGQLGRPRISFSPAWDVDFLYYAALARGANIIQIRNGDVALNHAALESATDLGRRWIEANGGVEVDARFANGRLGRPLHDLLLDRQIDFFLTDPLSFQQIPESKRSALVISWLGDPDRLPLADGVTYAGIPSGSRNTAGARAFLLWLFSPQTIAALLDVNRLKRLETFGIAGGLPAIAEVTEQEIPKRYPFILGRAPSRSQVGRPPELPADWARLRQAVVDPWLKASLRGPPPSDLAAEINANRRRKRLAAPTEAVSR